jgi:hypothetical protein
MYAFRKRRDVRPNDYFMEQIVELDNDLRKEREFGLPRSLYLLGLNDLKDLPKPWHYEFWNGIPDDLPFDLLSFKPCLRPTNFDRMTSKAPPSKRASIVSNASSEWEWEYYDDTEEEDIIEE